MSVEPEAARSQRGESASSLAHARSSSSAYVEMLRRVTRHMTTTQELPALLASITSALMEHTGSDMVRLFLYLADDECEVCRAPGSTGSTPGDVEKRLHLCASDALLTDVFGPDHAAPLHAATTPSRVARERRPFLTNDLLRDVGDDIPLDLRRRYAERGIIAAGAYPLHFRGELMGVFAMLSRERFDPKAFELLGIFADQAAMAIKSAHLFRELERYKRRLQVENEYLQDEIRSERGFEEVIGQSPALRAVLRKVKQVASVETTVLLTGETGTGKELVARAIHALSPRKDRPMIKMNCGAIPQGVVESELFGHERGAFTGALQRRVGRFELADKGTLFMDEVGELPLDTQVKLLRVLQEQEFERVGGGRPIQVDVRLVAATNRDLDREVADARFRSDLFYRLNVFPIRIPPLRERRDDIQPLVRHFLAHFQRKLAKPLRGVTSEGMKRLEAYDWPGNIRELQNVLERACVLARGPVVDIADALGSAPDAGAASMAAIDDAIVTLDEHERLHIRRAIEQANGKIHGPGGAAALLGVNASTLRSRMEKHGMGKTSS
jgi:formate hydrogenlyase transcriptional activator